jgi:ankyrin repeat protein
LWRSNVLKIKRFGCIIFTLIKGIRMNNKGNSNHEKFLESFEEALKIAETQPASLTTLNKLYSRVEEICKETKNDPLLLVSGLGYTRVARAIINHGHDVNVRNAKGLTPLHMATVFDQVEVSKVLLENGAKVDPIEKTGKTPIHIAAHKGNSDLVRLFLKFGANLGIRTPEGFNAAQIALAMERTEVAGILKEHFIQSVINMAKYRIKPEVLEPCNSPLEF